MSGFVLTPLATVDIFHVWTYIARHNQDAADRVEQAIFDACAFLAEGPFADHCRYARNDKYPAHSKTASVMPMS